jgi:NitT/TauT family transport system permease protein
LKAILSGDFLRDSRSSGLLSLTIILGFFSIWEIFARAGALSKLIFPAPSLIFLSFIEGMLNGDFSEALGYSLTRIVFGFLIGGGAGLVLGLLMGWSRRVRGVLDPIIAALHPIPKFALLPMVIIFFGIGEQSRIVMVSIGAFFPMVINTMAGVLQINPTHYEVVQNYGASPLAIFRRVVLPGSLPFALTGARLSLRSSLTITIGIEMVFSNTGLGAALWLSWQTMRMIDMYSILIIVSSIGFILILLLATAKKILTPWDNQAIKRDQ